MKFSLKGDWQISPLSDLTIPQADIVFPAPLSSVLPGELSEESIAQQEWHLMHDIEVDEVLLRCKAIDLVLEGIDFYAEVRLNGVAIFDCDKTRDIYHKEICSLLQPGRNRFEILFLEDSDELLLEEDQDDVCMLGSRHIYDRRMGIWREPYLELINHVRMTHVATEQVWHHGGGCEFIVDVYFDLLSSGLVSASVQFNGLTYTVPVDMRQNKVRAIFQIDAPKYFSLSSPEPGDLYTLLIDLDGQSYRGEIGLSEDLCVTHFPL